MLAHLAKQDKSLAAPHFPGVQRSFPPLLSWDFMDQLVSSLYTLAWMKGRAQGALQHSQPADSCHTSVQNPPQTTAPAWTDRRMHLETAFVTLGCRKPQAGVYTPLGAPVQLRRASRWQNPKNTEKFKASCRAGAGVCSFPGMVCGKQGAEGFPGTFSSRCCSWHTPYSCLYEEGELLRV